MSLGLVVFYSRNIDKEVDLSDRWIFVKEKETHCVLLMLAKKSEQTFGAFCYLFILQLCLANF